MLSLQLVASCFGKVLLVKGPVQLQRTAACDQVTKLCNMTSTYAVHFAAKSATF